MPTLYLCEKPSQAKSLAKVLGARQETGCWRSDTVIVTYAVGHLLRNAEPQTYGKQYSQWRLSTLPLLPTSWITEVVPQTAAQYRVVAGLLKTSTDLVIATDADREGEVIARELIDAVCYKGQVRRLWVSDSTDVGLKKALKAIKPGNAFETLYASGLGRSRADWLAGMNMTRAISTAFSRSGPLHFGRVITPTLALVVRKERAIRKFVPKAYFTINSSFELAAHKPPVSMRWQALAALLDAQGHLVDAATSKAVVAAVRGALGEVVAVTKTDQRTPAPLLYYLGSLQKECSSKFGLSPSDTLACVQSLYQDHKLVTYPRTDCEYISHEMFAEVPAVLHALGVVDPTLAAITSPIKLTIAGRAFNTAKVAASAHHAIIPTAQSATQLSALSPPELKVYDLIRRRYIAQFLGDFEYAQTDVKVLCAGHTFLAVGKVALRAGWKQLYAANAKSSEDNEAQGAEEVELPPLEVGDRARNITCESKATKTTPPKRYTAATLLTAMESIDKEIEDPRLAAIMRSKEKVGIGTDATRGEILDKLVRREYVAIEKKVIVPSARAESLIEVLEKVCPEAVDLALTAVWEDQLTQVEKGHASLPDFERSIGQFIERQIALIRLATADPQHTLFVSGGSPSTKTSAAPDDEGCPKCARAVAPRKGTYGPFWSCSGYPDCNTTFKDNAGKRGAMNAASASISAPVTPGTIPSTTYTCPACNRARIRRPGNDGKSAWWSCSGYANGCTVTASDDNGAPVERIVRPTSTAGKVGEGCPTCKQGKLTQKATHGRVFLGCTQFPTCRHFNWLNA